MLRASHAARAIGDRSSRIKVLKRKAAHPLSGPFRDEVSQPCGRRCHLQRQTLMSLVVHGLQRGSGARPRALAPVGNGLATGAVEWMLSESGAGEGSLHGCQRSIRHG